MPCGSAGTRRWSRALRTRWWRASWTRWPRSTGTCCPASWRASAPGTTPARPKPSPLQKPGARLCNHASVAASRHQQSMDDGMFAAWLLGNDWFAGRTRSAACSPPRQAGLCFTLMRCWKAFLALSLWCCQSCYSSLELDCARGPAGKLRPQQRRSARTLPRRSRWARRKTWSVRSVRLNASWCASLFNIPATCPLQASCVLMVLHAYMYVAGEFLAGVGKRRWAGK